MRSLKYALGLCLLLVLGSNVFAGPFQRMRDKREARQNQLTYIVPTNPAGGNLSFAPAPGCANCPGCQQPSKSLPGVSGPPTGTFFYGSNGQLFFAAPQGCASGNCPLPKK